MSIAAVWFVIVIAGITAGIAIAVAYEKGYEAGQQDTYDLTPVPHLPDEQPTEPWIPVSSLHKPTKCWLTRVTHKFLWKLYNA